MRNAFVILLAIVAIWVGIEVMNHGMSGAFGGLFAQAGLAARAPTADATLAKRAARAVDSAYRSDEARVERQAGE